MKQRQLTQEEIDIAPEWATHYLVGEYNDILFQSDDYFQRLEDGLLNVKVTQVTSGISRKAQPIPRKAFDISEYKFTSGDINIIHDDGGLFIEVDSDRSLFAEIKKCDAIAIAKALGVKPEDL